MHLLNHLLWTLSAAAITTTAALAAPSHLWATHYNGNVYTLTLSGDAFSVTDTRKTCGDLPSWLTFDSHTRTLYCSDESGTSDPSTHGSLTAYHAAADGVLHELATTETIGGGVNSVIYEGDNRKKFIAIAHYEGSAVSTFALPLHDNASTQQAFHFHMKHPGAVSQQDAPHPHEVFLDPTGTFLISPDLGMDVLHVYAINSATGHLSSCPSVKIQFGSGPRHGVFWTDGTGKEPWWVSAGDGDAQRHMWAPVGKTMMYLVNEIGGTMMVFDVAYSRSGCISFYKKQTLVPYTNGEMPEGATPAEIREIGNAFYVSIRSDGGFPGKNDSMVMLDRSPRSGLVSLRNKTPAHGKVPRTFAINRAGDLVAIGNQASATVAIVRRDRESGILGEQVAILQVGEPGKVGTTEGLSSVIWDE
ncbi:uncharacterized protein PFLUO_LOCUS9294 [Penicillium psychrofluorescens]|uniref:uncharacterized protein n=1 Tax=Penicillium psychrofluorescens TaxID=3158075 RepID=UPI003CCCDEC6